MTGKKLVVVESPSKAKTITKMLGKNYVVVASQGHVRDLPKSKLGVDEQKDFEPQYINIRGKGTLITNIKKQAKACDKVLLATDPDREGEAISWHLAYILGLDENDDIRVEFNEITKEAIQNAVNNPRKIDRDKVDAQQARRVIDRLVGYGISPVLWAKVKKGLSAGRVQSVATKLVVERDREIDNFVPVEYWDISADLSFNKETINAKLTHVDNAKAHISDKQQASDIEKRIKKASLAVSEVNNTTRKRNPSPPFITSTLQQAAVSKLNFSVSKTMQVVQQLYEGVSIGKKGTVGLVTYIRTDSVRVSEKALYSVREYIKSNYGNEYLPTKPNYYKGRNNAQDAHEAIRPTYLENTPESIKDYLTRDQYRLYSLIYNRFVSSQMLPAVFDVNNIVISGDGLKLSSNFEKRKFDGFLKVYDSDEILKNKNMPFPNLNVGDKAKAEKVHKTQCFTEPKPHYTEASLVKELEERGIGRPSTYAPTISTIISRGYISKDKKALYSSELGCIVTDILDSYFTDILNYDFTAKLEDRLDEVSEGDLNWKETIRSFYSKFKEELEKASSEISKVQIKDEVSDVVCEKCGRNMVYKMGKFGRFLACPGFPECSNTKPIVEYISAKCPKCGGRIVKKTSIKRKKLFYGCENYPKCDFTSWDKPVDILCPKCNSYMVDKSFRKKKIYLCSNKECNNKIEVK